MDLFELMGIETPVEEKKEAKENKKAKKPDSKGGKSVKKAVEYTLPVDIVIPYCDKIGGFSIEGKTAVTEKDILDEMKSRYPWLINTSLVKADKNTIEIKYPSGIKKGAVKGSTFMYGINEIPFPVGEDGTDTEVLKKAFYDSVSELNGCPVGFTSRDNTIVPILEPQKIGKELKLTQASVIVVTPGVAVAKIDLADKKVLTSDDILSVAPESLKQYLTPCAYKNGNVQTIVLMPSKQVEVAAATASATKSFSIADSVQISLGFTKVDLNPADFDGREEVEASDICAFLVAQGWPEFSKERTSIEKVNSHLLVAILKSSSKGAVNTVTVAQIPEECKKEYSLFQFEKGGYTYRGEKTRLGIFLMCNETEEYSSFKLLLPKIPIYMWRAAANFFGCAAYSYDTEAALQLFYDTEKEQYFFYVPHQKVTHSSVEFIREMTLEYDDRYILVADMHSHGHIGAFFSSVDNADELGTRIFAVFGGYKDNFNPDIKIRVGSGGMFKSISMDEIVDNTENEAEYAQVMESLVQGCTRIKRL